MSVTRPQRRLPWWADVVLAVLITALYVGEIWVYDASVAAAVSGVAALSGLGLAIRRLQPLVAFLCCAGATEVITRLAPGFDNDSSALVLTFFISLYSVGRHTAGRDRWLGAVAVLAVIVSFIVDEAADGTDPGDVLFAIVFVGAPWLAGLTLRVRHDREHLWRARAEAMRAEQEERERRAVTAERSRIARELHDVVSHAIAVTVLQSRGARKLLGTDEAAVRRALDAIDRTNTQALSDMRRLLALLRDTEDSPLDAPQPTLEQLPALIDEVRNSGLEVAFRERGSANAVPPGVELSVYRIVQEALTNVIKHAGSTARAQVEVEYGDSGVELCVTDDGPGPPQSTTGGHGLIGIRERVAVVGGTVETGASRDGGFALDVRIPYAVDA